MESSFKLRKCVNGASFQVEEMSELLDKQLSVECKDN